MRVLYTARPEKILSSSFSRKDTRMDPVAEHVLNSRGDVCLVWSRPANSIRLRWSFQQGYTFEVSKNAHTGIWIALTDVGALHGFYISPGLLCRMNDFLHFMSSHPALIFPHQVRYFRQAYR
jgi:hypothetical protein